MHTLLRSAAAATLSALVAAAPAAAQEGTYALNAQKKYAAGDVYTFTFSKEGTQKIRVTVQGQVVQDKNDTTKQSYTRVVKVLEANALGHKLKEHQYFSKFSITEGGFDDDTLTGKVIEVWIDASGARKWRHHAGEGNIGPAAKRWLDSEFGGSPDLTKEKKRGDDAYTPKEPVRVGDTWDVDVVSGLGSRGLEIKKDDATATCTLEAIETKGTIEMARLKLEAKFTMLGFPGIPPGTPIEWVEPGRATVTMQGLVPTTARLAPRERSDSFAMKGVATMQGATVELDVSEKSSRSQTLAGTIPELPLVPAPAAGGDGGEDGGDKK